MNTRISLRIVLQSYGRWALVFAVPLAANLLLWRVLVEPQRASVRNARDAQAIATLKPKLEALTNESRQLRAKSGQTAFTQDDPSSVMQMVQRLAARHKVAVKELSSKGQTEKTPGRSIAGYSTVPIDLQVSGRFNQLAHWISAVESQPGLQVESWTLAPGKDAADPTSLTVVLTAFLRNS